MKPPAVLPLAAAVAALAGAAVPAAAGAAAPLGTFTYKVVKATHTSTVTRSDTGYQGRSTATWSLSRASSWRMTWMAGGLYSGTGRVNVRGRYDVDITTDLPSHCAFAAPTGDAEHLGVAPKPFDLTVAPDARRPGQAAVGFVAPAATLQNEYLPSECKSSGDEPTWEDMETIDVAPARLRAKTIRLTFAGTRNGAGGTTTTYRTEIVLQRRR